MGSAGGGSMMTSTVMETIYRKIELEGVWLVDPKQTTYEQQQAILALRKAGRIEQAAYGGLKIKRDWRVQAEPPKADDLSQVEYIAIPQHKRSALVVMRDGRKMMFKVSAPEYLAGLITLAKSLGKPEPFSYSGTMIYRVK